MKGVRHEGCGRTILKSRIGAKRNLEVTSKLQIPKLRQSHYSEGSASSTSEDDSLPKEIDATPTFHDKNKKIPLFSIQPRNGKSFKAREIWDILFKDQPDEAKCTRQPMKVKHNAAFLIDVGIVPLDDLPADGNGRYANNGQVTHTYTNPSNGRWKKKGDSR